MWVLLVMILMRLVWMQRRQYTETRPLKSQVTLTAVEPECSFETRPNSGDLLSFENIQSVNSWFSVPIFKTILASLCQDSKLDVDKLLRINQWVWVAAVFFAALAIRLIGFNWLVCLLVVTTLMSRGRFIATNGVVGTDSLSALVFAVLFALSLLFYRTSSWWVFASILFTLSLALGIESAYVFWVLVPLLFVAFARLYRRGSSSHTDEAIEKRNLFQLRQVLADRKQSWISWISKQKHWLIILWWCFIWVICAFYFLSIDFLPTYEAAFGDVNLGLIWERLTKALPGSSWLSMSLELNRVLDTHFIVSFVIVFLTALMGSRLPHLQPASILALVSLAVMLLGAWVCDQVDLMFLSPIVDKEKLMKMSESLRVREVVFWAEPTLISLGLASLWSYFAYKVRFLLRRSK